LSLAIFSVYARVLAHFRLGATTPEWRMNETTANTDLERFRAEAATYAAYLETPEGRLRLDLAFANLQDLLPHDKRSLRAFDLGGGTGALAVRLARLGLHVTVLDASLPMLDFAKGAAEQAGVTDRIVLQEGDAAQCADLFRAGSFDVILCHNVLEFVEDPGSVLRSAARLLRNTSSILSILVRNQAGEVLKAALINGDLAAAERNLASEWGDESLYGGKVRLFTPGRMRVMMPDSLLAVAGEWGVRVMADYLPPAVSRTDNYERIFELERKLGRRPEFAAVARYTHWLARRADRDDHSPVTKDDA
jgi:S-adenosylmethionine-dependent methyltransferase